MEGVAKWFWPEPQRTSTCDDAQLYEPCNSYFELDRCRSRSIKSTSRTNLLVTVCAGQRVSCSGFKTTPMKLQCIDNMQTNIDRYAAASRQDSR